jgi:hypothetical protein
LCVQVSVGPDPGCTTAARGALQASIVRLKKTHFGDEREIEVGRNMASQKTKPPYYEVTH